MFHSVRKPLEEEIGIFIAHKNRECGFIESRERQCQKREMK